MWLSLWHQGACLTVEWCNVVCARHSPVWISSSVHSQFAVRRPMSCTSRLLWRGTQIAEANRSSAAEQMIYRLLCRSALNPLLWLYKKKRTQDSVCILNKFWKANTFLKSKNESFIMEPTEHFQFCVLSSSSHLPNIVVSYVKSVAARIWELRFHGNPIQYLFKHFTLQCMSTSRWKVISTNESDEDSSSGHPRLVRAW